VFQVSGFAQEGIIKIVAVDIANMFNGLRSLVVSQSSLFLSRQHEQDYRTGTLQKRVQRLEAALSDSACQALLVR